MVAITVILAAVIGTFVLDIGQDAQNDSPQASLNVEINPASDTIDIEHMGGDELVNDRTKVLVEVPGGQTTFDATTGTGDNKLSVGETANITLNSGSPDNLDFDGDNTADQSISGPADGFDPGDSVTVTLIDTGTGRYIFQTTVTA